MRGTTAGRRSSSWASGRSIAAEYGARHGGAGALLTPLWGQVDEPSGRSEMVFLATVGTEDRWGVVRSSESGAEFVVDEPLPDQVLALAAVLPGDEVARLVVVALPRSASCSTALTTPASS